MIKNEPLAIIGGGSWATALAKILTEKNNISHWWIKEKEVIKSLKKQGENQIYFPNIKINTSQILITDNLKEIVSVANILLLCYPAPFLHNILGKITSKELEKKLFISAIKGIVPETNMTVSEYLQSYHKIPQQNIAVLSGPSHSEEVAAKKTTFLTIASSNSKLKNYVESKFQSDFLEIKKSKDMIGIEFVAVLKNIYAIGAGIAIGLGYGDNFISVYMANATKEIETSLTHLAKNNRNLFSSVYLGDLLVTCYSKYSRNRHFGNLIGKGYSVKSAQKEMKMIAEGFFALKSIKNIIKNKKMQMPIIEAIYKIVFENLSPIESYFSLKKFFN